MADNELDALQAELDRVLEHRIADLLSYVKAAKELVRGISTADGELRRLASQRDGLDDRARRGDREARARLDAVDRSVDRIAEGREKLLGDLNAVLAHLGQ